MNFLLRPRQVFFSSTVPVILVSIHRVPPCVGRRRAPRRPGRRYEPRTAGPPSLIAPDGMLGGPLRERPRRQAAPRRGPPLHCTELSCHIHGRKKKTVMRPSHDLLLFYVVTRPLHNFLWFFSFMCLIRPVIRPNSSRRRA